MTPTFISMLAFGQKGYPPTYESYQILPQRLTLFKCL